MSKETHPDAARPSLSIASSSNPQTPGILARLETIRLELGGRLGNPCYSREGDKGGQGMQVVIIGLLPDSVGVGWIRCTSRACHAKHYPTYDDMRQKA